MDEGVCMEKKWIKKIIDPGKSDRSPLGYLQALILKKLIRCQQGIHKVFKILILSHVGSWLGISWKWVIYDNDDEIVGYMIPRLGPWLIPKLFFNNQPILVQINASWLLVLNNCWV